MSECTCLLCIHFSKGVQLAIELLNACKMSFDQVKAGAFLPFQRVSLFRQGEIKQVDDISPTWFWTSNDEYLAF